MPSAILTAASGAPFPIISGNFWSGKAVTPVGGIRFRLDPAASGNAYISLSGVGGSGGTIKSGGFFLSGYNTTDGMLLAPTDDGYFLPRLAIALSGTINVYAACDPAASGVARLYWEMF